jgi:hypothetical protein
MMKVSPQRYTFEYPHSSLETTRFPGSKMQAMIEITEYQEP